MDKEHIQHDEHLRDEGIKDDDDYEDKNNVDLADIFPNTDENPIEYVYTRDKTGRVVTVDCRLKVLPNVSQTKEVLKDTMKKGDEARPNTTNNTNPGGHHCVQQQDGK
jgi:hypothetical protein